MHEVPGEVFNVGVVPGLGKPCIIGTLVMAWLGIGIHPGSPGTLALTHPDDRAKIMGWARQEKMEAITPYPADPVDWSRVEQSFWGKERRTWGGDMVSPTPLRVSGPPDSRKPPQHRRMKAENVSSLRGGL